MSDYVNLKWIFGGIHVFLLIEQGKDTVIALFVWAYFVHGA